MIKIEYPRSIKEIAPYFDEEKCKKDLFVIARDDEQAEAAIRFRYRGETVDIYEFVFINPEVSEAVLDGLIRMLLFQMAENGCTRCRVHGLPVKLESYFKNHEFTHEGDFYAHDGYIDEFFKPCPGCAGA